MVYNVYDKYIYSITDVGIGKQIICNLTDMTRQMAMSCKSRKNAMRSAIAGHAVMLTTHV